MCAAIVAGRSQTALACLIVRILIEKRPVDRTARTNAASRTRRKRRQPKCLERKRQVSELRPNLHVPVTRYTAQNYIGFEVQGEHPVQEWVRFHALDAPFVHVDCVFPAANR